MDLLSPAVEIGRVRNGRTPSVEAELALLPVSIGLPGKQFGTEQTIVN